MEQEVIRKKVPQIPKSKLGSIPTDKDIWELTDGGAHFKMTRHELPIGLNIEFLALSVSGIRAERERLIGEFIQVLGIPEEQSLVPESNIEIDMLSWLIKKDN